MNTMNKLAMAAWLGFALQGAVHAAPTVIAIDTYLNGNGTTQNATVATLSLEQVGSDVSFTLSNSVGNVSGNHTSAYISELYFSYTGSTVLTSSSFTSFGGTQVVAAADFGINPGGADSGYDFYLDLDYPTSNANGGALRFTDGEFSTWVVKNVLLNDFLTLVTGSGAPSLAMVHIQSFNNGDSAKFIGDASEGGTTTNEIPEPASLGLLALGLLAAGWASRSAASRRR